jgi:hypothetical protein
MWPLDGQNAVDSTRRLECSLNTFHNRLYISFAFTKKSQIEQHSQLAYFLLFGTVRTARRAFEYSETCQKSALEGSGLRSLGLG